MSSNITIYNCKSTEEFNNILKRTGYENIFSCVSIYREYLSREQYSTQPTIIKEIINGLPNKQYFFVSDYYYHIDNNKLDESFKYLNEQCIMLRDMDKNELRKIDDMHLIYISRLYQLCEILVSPPGTNTEFNPHKISKE